MNQRSSWTLSFLCAPSSDPHLPCLTTSCTSVLLLPLPAPFLLFPSPPLLATGKLSSPIPPGPFVKLESRLCLVEEMQPSGCGEWSAEGHYTGKEAILKIDLKKLAGHLPNKSSVRFQGRVRGSLRIWWSFEPPSQYCPSLGKDNVTKRLDRAHVGGISPDRARSTTRIGGACDSIEDPHSGVETKIS